MDTKSKGKRRRRSEPQPEPPDARPPAESLPLVPPGGAASGEARGTEKAPVSDPQNFPGLTRDGYIVTDSQGLILEINRAAAEFLNGRADLLLGRPLSMFFAAEHRNDVYALFTGFGSVAALQNRELVLEPPRGKPLDVLVTVAPASDEEGRLTYRWLLHDVTSTCTAEGSLREQNEFLDGLVEKLPVALAVVDLAGGIVRVNRCLETLSGREADELFGRDWCSLFLFESEREQGRRLLLNAVRDGAADSGVLGFVSRGKTRLVRWSAKALTDTARTRVILLGYDVSDLERTRLRRASILDSAPSAILTLDENGRIESFNRAGERLFGYGADEIIGQNVEAIIPAFRALPPSPDEALGRHKNGVKFPIACSVNELHGDIADGGARWFTCIVHDLTQRRELEQQILEVAAAEQRRIGQDLHDEVGQELTGLSLLADNLVHSFADPTSDDARTAVKVFEGIKRTLRLVRRLSQGLVPVDVDPGGLMAALQDLCAHTSELPGVHCTFRATGTVLVEDNTVATHLYRIAKEAVTNALRHSQAKNIRVTLSYKSEAGTLAIRDDGIGLKDNGKGGMGLRIMRHRAELIGGKVTIKKDPTGGTLVRCVFGGGGRAIRNVAASCQATATSNRPCRSRSARPPGRCGKPGKS